MQPLLDFIFGKLDLPHLNRDEVHEHLLFLEEIILPAMPVEEQIKFLNFKVKLNRRLVQIDNLRHNSATKPSPDKAELVVR